MIELKLKNFKAAVALMMLALSPFCSCMKQDGGRADKSDEETVSVSLSIHSDEEWTKSALSPDESIINDINILVYTASGSLYTSWFGESGKCTIRLDRGQSYVFHTLVNYGSAVTAPDRSSELESLSLDYDIRNSRGAMPMSGSTGVIRINSDTSVEISVRRLLAKVGIKVDESLLKTATYHYKSLTVRQCPSHISPWGQAFAESSRTVDGDYASRNDMDLIRERECFFYVPENRRGRLMDNNDPWKKTPGKLDCASMLPYVELCAEYNDHGLSDGNSKFRFYLGSNNTDNFDVERGRIYHITLMPSDEGIFKGSWKLEAENMTNSRKISFNPSSLTLTRKSPSVVQVKVEPEDLTYELEYDSSQWKSMGVSLSRNGNMLTLNSSYQGTTPLELSLEARDYAGLTRGGCRINVKEKHVPQLIPDKAVIDVWGGNSYPLTFSYMDEEGQTLGNVSPKLEKLVLSGGIPSSMLTCSGQTLTAQDWWGLDGNWVKASPEYEAHFSYDGTTAIVKGKIKGHTGFGELHSSHLHYREITKQAMLVLLDKLELVGSETTDASRGTYTAELVSSNGSALDRIPSNWKGNYLKVGNYHMQCTVTDPSCGKERSTRVPVSVESNVSSVRGRITFSELEGGSHMGSDSWDDFDTKKSGPFCPTDIDLYCDVEEEIRFRISGSGLQYYDYKGTLRQVDKYDDWAGADLFKGYDNFYIDWFTGEEAIIFKLNGYEFSIGYRVN